MLRVCVCSADSHVTSNKRPFTVPQHEDTQIRHLDSQYEASEPRALKLLATHAPKFSAIPGGY
jgi:hypothetical protein